MNFYKNSFVFLGTTKTNDYTVTERIAVQKLTGKFHGAGETGEVS